MWLASGLELIGYNVWIDKNELLGSESSGKKSDSVIRNDAFNFFLYTVKKFLLMESRQIEG
jgi:hypothetical protein